MKRRKFSIKRALALAMTVIMCAGTLPVTVFAATEGKPWISRYSVNSKGRVEITNAYTDAEGAKITKYSRSVNMQNLNGGTWSENQHPTTWQTSPTFNNLERGCYYFYVKDSLGNISEKMLIGVFNRSDVTEYRFAPPAKTVFEVGEKLPEAGYFYYVAEISTRTPEGGYSNTTTRYQDWITSSMYGPYDNTKPGTVRVAVTSNFGDKEYINVTFENKVKSIAVENPCTEYIIGESFKNQGNIVLTWSDGTKTKVPLTSSYVSNFSTDSVVTGKRIKVTYDGKTAYYNINVKPKTYVATIKTVGATLDSVYTC